jgi:hypothetical protein
VESRDLSSGMAQGVRNVSSQKEKTSLVAIDPRTGRPLTQIPASVAEKMPAVLNADVGEHDVKIEYGPGWVFITFGSWIKRQIENLLIGLLYCISVVAQAFTRSVYAAVIVWVFWYSVEKYYGVTLFEVNPASRAAPPR